MNPIIYWCLISILLALLEIEIEGKDGWAKSLPTIQIKRGPLAKLFFRLMGGKNLTGYHLTFFSLVLLMNHQQYFYETNWEFRAELLSLANFLTIAVAWDFLWFILNPHFGLKKFKRENVWWHKKWLFGIPNDYYIGLTLGLMLSYLSGSIELYLYQFLTLAMTIILAMIIAPSYHNFYKRKAEENDKAPFD